MKWLSLVLLAVVTAALGYIVARNLDQFRIVFDVSPFHLGLLIAGCFLFIAAQGEILRAVLRPYNARLTAIEAFGLIAATLFTNYFIPFLGFGLRAEYLRRVYGLSYARFGVTLFATLIVELALYALAGLISLAFIASYGGAIDPLIALVFAGIVSGFLALLLWRSSFLPSWAVLKPVRRALMAWEEFRRHGSALLGLVVWTFVEFLGFSLAFFAAYRGIDYPIDIFPAIVTAALSDFAFLVRLTPAGLGSFEAVVYYASRAQAVTLPHAILIAMLVRFGLMIVFTPVGLLFFLRLTKLMREARG